MTIFLYFLRSNYMRSRLYFILLLLLLGFQHAEVLKCYAGASIGNGANAFRRVRLYHIQITVIRQFNG